MFSYNQNSSPSGKQWIALSTQSVGVGQGGTVSMIARVSLVDYRGKAIFDTYIRPTAPVASYRTPQTGIEPHHLENGIPFDQVRSNVASAISGKILVGHSLWLDLHVLGLTHPAINTRDLGLFLPFRVVLRNLNGIIGLQTLVYQMMRRHIAVSVQDSLENARAIMDLFRSVQEEWERCVDDNEWPCALPPAQFARCYS